jgi:glycosyltransferase involved in cell wall biosynthesis
MDRDPSITVVVPTRDRLQLLKEAVASVTAQDWPEVELVIVDDASSDGTREWLQQIQGGRVRAILHDEHQERSRSRNAGLDAASGDCVLFLDDDDKLRPGALRALAQPLRHDQDVVAVVGGKYDFDDQGHSKRYPHPRRAVRTSPWRELLQSWLAPPGAMLIKTAMVRSLGGWNETLALGEDRELMLRLARAGRFTIVPSAVLDVRVHGPHHPPEMKEIRRATMNEFAKTLSGSDRVEAQRALDTRRLLELAEDSYVQGDPRASLRTYWRAFRTSPVRWSRLEIPALHRPLVKSLVGSIVGRRIFLAVRGLRWRIRLARKRAPWRPSKD